MLLLGQYSDDELEEEKRITEPSVVEGSSVDHNEKVEECMDGKGEKDGYEDKLASPGDEEKNAADGNLEPVNAVKKFDRHIGESSLTAPNKKYGEVDSMSGVCVSGMQTDQDATSEWKIVMHEESNRYYYWNTMTGETSWEVPDVLVRGMETASGQKLFPIVEKGGSTPLDAHSSGTNLNGELDVYPNASVLGGHMSVNSINSAKEHLGSGIEMETGNIESKDINDPILDENHNAVNMTYKEASAPDDSFSAQQSSMILSGLGGSATTGNEHPITINGKEKNGQPMVADDCAEASTDHFAQLLKFGENLLERLEVPEGSGNQAQAYDWRLKFILEIKIRLSDCKALAYYGSTLLPFWWHTDTCFKQLEAAIVEKTSQSARQEHSNEEMLQITSCKDNDTSCQIMGIETGVGVEDNELPSSTFENIYASTGIVDTSKVVQNGSLSSGSSGSELGEIEPGEIREEVNEYPVPVCLIPKIEFHAGDDADMDVDMEVDNENPTDHITSMDALSSKGFAQPEQPTYLNTDLSLVESTPSEPVEEFNAPPPPDEEWIPPPPPDTEPVPPPPPDEPPAHFYPTTPYAEAMPPVPYTGQYNFTYPASTYGYYVPSITDTTNTTYYAPAGSCENSEIQAPPYHQPAANVLPEAIPAAVNPVEAVVYYGLQNGAAPGPEISSLESCTFYSEPVSYDNVASGHMGSVAVAPDSGYAPMPSLKVESSTTVGENDVNLKVASTLASAETTGAAAINENTMAAATTVDAKNPPKIVRSKKRTVAVAPTLRSNKKVSSLVDKWKAAKEELHGDEDDEPENAYEMLEKKKQREIEEWRAQQIASGEARENANFQPLGGDWRERVKRKRAKSSSDTKQAPSKVTTSEQQQPNLMELSKDLPSGWQAYWDESSKQVYYGHAITSETTWTRPSR